MTTGQRIKEARKNAGMTQIELAQKLNIPFQSVSQWERDVRKPKVETLRRIANALGIQPWELDENASDMADIAFSIAKLVALRKIIDENDNISVAMLKAAISEIYTDADDDGAIISLSKVFRRLYTIEETSDVAAELLGLFNQLNPDGQQKAVERVEELTEVPRYRADTIIPESAPTTDSPASED